MLTLTAAGRAGVWDAAGAEPAGPFTAGGGDGGLRQRQARVTYAMSGEPLTRRG